MKNYIMMVVAAVGLCAIGTIAEANYPHYYKAKWYPRYVGTTVTYYYSNYYSSYYSNFYRAVPQKMKPDA